MSFLARSSLAAALALAAVSTVRAEGPAAAGGTADGWFEVAKERTVLRHAWVRGESGDGASDELVVVLADRELGEEAVVSAGLRDELAAEGGARSLTARLPGEGGEIELLLHHPKLPAGLSLRGLARFVPESVTSARLEGRILLPGATAVEVWFSAPIERVDRASIPEFDPATPPPPRPAMSIDEAIEAGGEEEFEAALEAAGAIEEPGSSGLRPLAAAASAGNLYAVRRLLESGAEVDGRADRAAMTALIIAAGKESVAVVDALLAAGANPKLRTSSGFSALMHAVIMGQLDVAKRLIAAGAEVARDRESLLRLAREKGFKEIEALLLAAPEAAPAAPANP
jgi:hypothetical protein